MLLPFLSLGCGIIFASLGLELWGGASAIISGVIIYFFIIHLSRNPINAFRYAYWHYVWLSLIFIGIGVVVGDFSRFYQPNDKEIKDKQKYNKYKKSYYWYSGKDSAYCQAVPGCYGISLAFPFQHQTDQKAENCCCHDKI